MWFGMGFMWLWLIGLIVIGVIVYFAITASSHQRSCSHTSQDYQPPQYTGNRALEILKERYAKGEITKEQYLQMKEELR